MIDPTSHAFNPDCWCDGCVTEDYRRHGYGPDSGWMTRRPNPMPRTPPPGFRIFEKSSMNEDDHDVGGTDAR
jgi:hypothetical protein